MAVLAECCCSTYFYPRPPRGGRREVLVQKLAAYEFLSTPSARRATIIGQELFFWCFISIHALREEGDPRKKSVHDKITDFYPRPPRGGRRTTSATTSCVAYFYPRPPRGGRLFKDQELTQVIDDFYPRPPRGGRREVLVENYSLRYISIHALREEGDD